MGKIKVINISDIHFDRNEPENQGLILNAFFKDIELKILASEKESAFCIISGDLVNKGYSDLIYNTFYDKFIKKLSGIIPIKNIYCIPGNHDLNRKIVEENLNAHNKIIEKSYSEKELNEFIKTDGNLLQQKFKFFTNFCQSNLLLHHINHFGYSANLIPEISVFFLNSALFSCGGYNGIKDSGKLKIETSELNKWILENEGRTKVLVMHHSIEDLSSFASKELNSMLLNGIDILISGHTHNQQLNHNYISENQHFIRLSSPQLFSDKNDLNGYSLLIFNDNNLESIEYRQWSLRQRKFMSGQDFSGTDNGIHKFSIPEINPANQIAQHLYLDLQKSMKSYAQTPSWIERFLSSKLPDQNSIEVEEKLDYLSIINKPDNYQIIAAPQFGLTCYAKYLALKAYEIKKDFWLYLDSKDWTFSKFISDIEESLKYSQMSEEDVRCLLLDNWKNNLRDANKIYLKIKKQFPNSNIIIFSNFDDKMIIKGLDTDESHEGFKQLYLRELNRKGLRILVREFNNLQLIGEENCVLERLSSDLNDLNIHRTPLNCMQLLIAFLRNYEERPVNRAKVFTYILKVIFDNPGNLFYGNNLDESNCIFILGKFCEFLLRENKETFTEREYYNVCTPFAEENYNATDVSDLLQVLKNNQILVSSNGGLRFRFSYWIYYFASARMRISPEFAAFMFQQKHSNYYPEIIEFYTGTDGAREDVVEMLIQDLKIAINTVNTNIGLKAQLNPFSDIKWKKNETVKGMTKEQLEESVRKSNLPDEIKDIIADSNYNSIKPYNQTINNFFDQYYVSNLMELTRSASRALRNSEFVKPELKEKLIQSIFDSWKEIFEILLLIAPILAKNGFGGFGGARFELASNFPKEYSECLKNIVTVMPFNLMTWYKDDLFSDKLIKLFNKYLIEFPDPVVNHVIALFICTCRPIGWNVLIMNYISRIGKNSYYLGDLYTILRYNYAIKFMNSKDLKHTENLIKTCWVKHDTGSTLPGKKSISKATKIIPKRSSNDLE